MSDKAKLTVDEILSLIRYEVWRLYCDDAFTIVRDLGELDGALFRWHWLYAHIVGRLNDFSIAGLKQDKTAFLKQKALIESDEPVLPGSESTQFVLSEWNKRGQAIGLTIDTPPARPSFVAPPVTWPET